MKNFQAKEYSPRSNKLFFGSFPYPADLEGFRNMEIDTIWNLAEELVQVAKNEKELFPHFVHTQIPDFSIPPSADKFLADLNLIYQYFLEGRNIYVHCWAGHGRTGMALAAFSMKLLGVNANRALEIAKENCSGPEVETQREFIRSLKI